MASVQTACYFLLGYLIVFACGYGIVRLLLPEKYREHEFFIMPVVGSVVLAWLLFALSAILRLPVSKVCWPGLALMLLISAVACAVRRPRHRLAEIGRGLGKNFLLSSTMLVFILWPLFYVGADTYLGAVNPDYFAGFNDNHYLMYRPANTLESHEGTYSPFRTTEGSLRPSARFSGALVAILLEIVLGISQRTALALTIAIFLACLPPSVYFMCRVAFGLNKPTSWLAGLLMGVSGCVAMSYLTFYIGQNTALAGTPLLIGVVFILLTDPSRRIILLTAVLVSSLYVLYAAMLPYAMAPYVIPAAYLLWTRELPVRRAIWTAASLLGYFVVANFALLPFLIAGLRVWRRLLSVNLLGFYFADFVTEGFVPTFLGLTPYPISSSWLGSYARDWALPIALVLSALLIIWLVFWICDWVRKTSNRHHLVVGLSALVVYFAAWWRYTFGQQYGYACFKLSTWLQFMLMPVVAYGLFRLWEKWRAGEGRWKRGALFVLLAASALLTAGASMVSSVHYGTTGLGTDLEKGIINTFDMSSNRDYFELESGLRKIVKPDESIGLAFTDSIQNSWVGYYLRDFKVSILSHVFIPVIDERLPDIWTRELLDSYGARWRDANMYFHGTSDAYYLLVNPDNSNSEIVRQCLPPPVWKNRTFQLIRADQARGFTVLGRGYYRREASYSPETRWWSERFRWVADGGEIYVLGARKPRSPARISMIAVVGYGNPAPSRHLELYLNGAKFDEIEIAGCARIVSAPVHLSENVNRIVFTIKEKTQPLARRRPLWNTELPADYRALNVGVTNIQIVYPEDSCGQPQPAVSLTGDALFEASTAFNGVDANRWIRKEGRFSYIRAAGNTGVRIVVSIPGRPEFRFPYSISVTADGETRTFQSSAPGEFSMTMPLAATGTPAPVDLVIRPSQVFQPAGYNQAIRGTEHSVRLEKVDFVKQMR